MFDRPVGARDFRVTCQLGQGSFGNVYQVLHRKSGQTLAMKLLNKADYSSAKMQKLARVERNILANVHHPYIVRLHYAFQTQAHLALVMDYCAGGSMEQLLKQAGRLSVKLSRHYVAQVLLALEHLHDLGVLYRDLKTANVLVDAEGHACLVDFGLCKEDNRGGSFVGSVDVLAPEILLRKGHDRRVDIYGLGVLLYTFLAGETPFYKGQRQRTWDAIMQSKLEMPAHITEDAASVISQLMERDPDQRLGCNSTEDVRTHAFFSEVDFEALLARSVAAPAGSPCECIEKAKGSVRRRDVFGDADSGILRLAKCFSSGTMADASTWENWDFSCTEDSNRKFAVRTEKLQTLFAQALEVATMR
jgi:serine/threonine protein kinase